MTSLKERITVIVVHDTSEVYSHMVTPNSRSATTSRTTCSPVATSAAALVSDMQL